MAVFTYSGRGTGGTMTGEIEAPDRTSAVGELRKRAILVTKIQERSGGKSPSKAGGKVKDKEMAIFTRQFSTMIDPGSIISVAFLVVIFMLTFVIPTFTKMFKDLGADLPLPTQVVVWLSEFVRTYILLIIAAVFGCVFALRAYYRTEKGLATIDALLLKVPVMGTLIRKVAVARFTRTLGTLVSSGVPILEGLRITARTAGNKVVETAVLQCRAAVT